MTAIETFFKQFPKTTYKKGEILVQAHQNPKGIFYITSGRVSQYDIAKNGNVIVVNTFQPPAFFPMAWAINKTPNVYFFEATTEVTVHIAPAEQAVAFLQDNPQIMLDLLSRVYRGTDGLLRRVAHLMGGSSRTRLVFEIINAGYRFGLPLPDGALLIPLKESDLAKSSGLARETVSRTIQELKNAQLLSVSAKGLTVTSLAQLEIFLGDDI